MDSHLFLKPFFPVIGTSGFVSSPKKRQNACSIFYLFLIAVAWNVRFREEWTPGKSNFRVRYTEHHPRGCRE